jgi:hypothetical protein
MPRTGWTPSIVPKGNDESVYLVVDDFGRNGRVYREADVETTDLETVILDLLEGQYQSPVRVVAFNTAEKWSQDVSADVAHELRQRCDLQMRDVPFFLQDFVDQTNTRAGIATCSFRCRCGLRDHGGAEDRHHIPASLNRLWRPRSPATEPSHFREVELKSDSRSSAHHAQEQQQKMDPSGRYAAART